MRWDDISSVAAIVELQSDDIRAEPSQGSHFFQNITSLGIPYLTIMEEKDGSTGICSSKKNCGACLDWNWLMAQENFEDTPFVRHIRLPAPFVMKCNGKEEIAVLYQTGEESQSQEVCKEEVRGKK